MPDPGWMQYEKWIHTHASAICSQLGIDVNGMTFQWNTHRPGRLSRHQIDVLGTGHSDNVFIECKRRDGALQRKELVDSRAAFLDLAACDPTKRSTLIVIVDGDTSRTGRQYLLRAPHVFIGSPERIRLLSAPHLPTNDAILVFEHTIDGAAVHVVTASPTSCSSDVLLVQAREGVTFSDRVAAGLRLFNMDPSSALASEGALEVSSVLFHYGASTQARWFASHVVETKASGVPLVDCEQARVVMAMAEFQRILRVSPRAARPGHRAVAALRRVVDDFTSRARIPALGFLAAWEGHFGSSEVAHKLFCDGLAQAQEYDDQEGAYQRFVLSLRRAANESEETLRYTADELRPFVTGLTPLHQSLAGELLRRVALGEDTSVRSMFRI